MPAKGVDTREDETKRTQVLKPYQKPPALSESTLRMLLVEGMREGNGPSLAKPAKGAIKPGCGQQERRSSARRSKRKRPLFIAVHSVA